MLHAPDFISDIPSQRFSARGNLESVIEAKRWVKVDPEVSYRTTARKLLIIAYWSEAWSGWRHGRPSALWHGSQNALPHGSPNSSCSAFNTRCSSTVPSFGTHWHS